MRKTLFGGLVALALALAPAAAANADYVDPNALHGVLDKYVAEPGETVTYTAPANTYDPNEATTQVITGTDGHTATLISTRMAPASATAKQFAVPAQVDGSHTFSFVMPATAADSYTVEVLRASGAVWDTFQVTVANATTGNPEGNGGNGGSGATDGSGAGGAGTGGSGSNGGGLAMTGSDIAIAGIGGAAVLLVGAGLTLMLVRRRRSSEETAAA
ncbi:hypothetical protein [Leifsonia shinshuensis]|uniref:LPXTG cell wall anchor domain-containing protein n=1 Tax=Leifsonia shinshuensis TaxID=150026 RepID=A0A853CX73_9MICO|nr:hypothetical protein [Leifsonia shinshuensis]NYJ23155.1 hypothetical protein [Leifsonia shinshuensis]